MYGVMQTNPLWSSRNQRPKRESGEDEEEQGQLALNDYIEDGPSFIEDVESGDVRDESGVDSQGFWSLYTMIGVPLV